MGSWRRGVSAEPLSEPRAGEAGSAASPELRSDAPAGSSGVDAARCARGELGPFPPVPYGACGQKIRSGGFRSTAALPEQGQLIPDVFPQNSSEIQGSFVRQLLGTQFYQKVLG